MECRAVVFDLFGTLIESPPMAYIEATISSMSAELQVDHESFRRLWFETNDLRLSGSFPSVAVNVEHICHQLGFHPSTSQVSRAADLVAAYSRRCLKRVHPGARDTLSKLRQRGLRLGLISDATYEVPKAWPGTPFAELIQEPVFSCEVKLKKPDPRIYQMAAERLRVTPSECVYVGDGGSNELSGAAEAGMLPILLAAPGQTDPAYVYRPGAQAWQGQVVNSLSELLSEIS